MIENGMVMPTDVNFDRKRQRKVVFYGRVSTEHEAQLAALENQIQWYDDIAAKNPNWYIVKKYIDEGITGTQAKKRPAFLQMVQDAKQKKFDLIVTREVCRFARNTVDTLVVTRELKNYGVEVYFVEDNIRTMDGDGELRLTIMATLAQEESRKISERVRAGQKISRDKGVLFGNGNILGYDRDKAKGTYVINPEQAETVRMIYDMYSAGKGMSQIRNELIRLKREDSSGLVRWENCKIARILHNSTYKGYPAYLKSRRNNFLDQKIIRNRDEDTYLYVKGDFEPIISEEQWDRCRQIREQRVRRNKILTENGEKSRLTGVHTSDDVWTKKLRCRCGYRMRRNKWRKNRNGELIYGYKCYNQLNNGTKTTRQQAGVDDSGFCDLKEICDWKLEMMARRIFSGLWGNKKDILNKVSSLYQVGVFMEYREAETVKDRVTEQLAKLDEKLKKTYPYAAGGRNNAGIVFRVQKRDRERKTRFAEQTAGAGCGNGSERKSGRSGEKGGRFFAGENGFYRPSYRQRRNRSVRRHDCSRYGNVLQLVYEFRPCRQIRRYEKARVGVYDRL